MLRALEMLVYPSVRVRGLYGRHADHIARKVARRALVDIHRTASAPWFENRPINILHRHLNFSTRKRLAHDV